MNHINNHTHQKEKNTDIPYIRSGDYYIPNLELPEETRSIGKWGRMHREYLKEHHPIQYTNLIISGQLWTYLADLNEQAQDRLDRITQQLKKAENVTESETAETPMMWVQHMNSIRNRAEEIVLRELIYVEETV
jgi:hypothetical protein